MVSVTVGIVIVLLFLSKNASFTCMHAKQLYLLLTHSGVDLGKALGSQASPLSTLVQIFLNIPTIL